LKERKDGKKKIIYRGTQLSRNAWMNGLIRSISGQWIKANSYFNASRDDAFEFAGKIAKTYSHKGAVIFEGHDDDCRIGELAAIIFDLQCYFDSVYGANAYKDPRRRKQFLTYLIDSFKILGIPIIDIFRFVSAFIETYGPIGDYETQTISIEGFWPPPGPPDLEGSRGKYTGIGLTTYKQRYSSGKRRPPLDLWLDYDMLPPIEMLPKFPAYKKPPPWLPPLPPEGSSKFPHGKPGSPENPMPIRIPTPQPPPSPGLPW